MPKLTAAALRGYSSAASDRPETSPRIVALVPAHNEEEQIGQTLEALLGQTRPLDRIMVIADRCSDRTEAIARRYGVEVLVITENAHKKAGALNQALPHTADCDLILQTDADTTLDPRFVEQALGEMSHRTAGVAGREGLKDVSRRSPWQRFLFRVVKSERYHYDSLRLERPDKAAVLAGTGVLLRRSALVEAGGWDVTSLTEDFALTLDLRQRGWEVKVGRRCYLWADTPVTLRALWRQRIRWQRGAVDDLCRRGLRRSTGVAFLNQAFMAMLGLMTTGYLAMLLLALANGGEIGWSPRWLFLPAVSLVDRLLRMRLWPQVDRADLVYAFSFAELLFFVWFWQAFFVAGWARSIRQTRQAW